ncbi:MAG: hypothetical protein AAGU75_01690 [Bacillota bacterium]
MNSKKGTTLVEASLIFPLVIAAVIAVLYIIIGLYLSLSIQTSLHLSLRKECGEISQTVLRLEDYKDYPFEKDRINFRSALVIEEEKEYQIKGIFSNRIKRKEFGRSYIIDEAEIVRLRSILKGES